MVLLFTKQKPISMLISSYDRGIIANNIYRMDFV